jgi:hypothetical protein
MAVNAADATKNTSNPKNIKVMPLIRRRHFFSLPLPGISSAPGIIPG